MGKLNSAIICFADGMGGMDMDAIKLAKKLTPHTKTILIAKKGSYIERQKPTYNQDICLHTIGFYSNFSLALIMKVRKIIQQHQIKNIIFFGTREIKSLYFSFLGRGINFIMWHGTTRSTSKKNWFYNFFYKSINYHVSISKHLERNTRHIFPFGKHTSSKLIYNSTDVKNSTYLRTNKLTLLHIGRVVHGKGQTDAITACEILEKQGIDFEFNIIGRLSDDYKKEFLDFYNKCPYKDKIKLFGHSDNIYQHFEGADIFLSPSYGEGLGNVFLEAFSTDIDVICYENTVFPEFKSLGFKFTMAKHLDIEELKEKLLYSVQNLPNQRTIHNSTLVEKIFSEKVQIDNYLQILQ